MSVPRSFLASTYRAALWLYPPGFRGEFGDELARDFDEAADEAWRSGGGDRLHFLAGVGRDLAATVVTQWVRTGAPVLALLPVGAAVGASRGPRGPGAVHADAVDRRGPARHRRHDPVHALLSQAEAVAAAHLRPCCRRAR
jgi:hypothetical protein